MTYIDPHIHMLARTTADYEAMASAGIVAVIEPAFWIGQPRTSVGSYIDYLSTLVGWERFRAAQFGVRHYCSIGLNSKEANNERLAEEVLEILPRFLLKEGVVAVGEIGYDEQTAAEDKYFRAQLELAKELGMLVQIHTPHRDKKRGTSRSMAVCIEHQLAPDRVIVDHNNEETVREVLDLGFWAAFTIYPHTKMGNERMVEIVRQYGSEHVFINSSADWGVSDPLAVPKTAQLMRERGIAEEQVRRVTYDNPLAAFTAGGQMAESDWLSPPAIDQRTLFEGNSVLRGAGTSHRGQAQREGADADRVADLPGREGPPGGDQRGLLFFTEKPLAAVGDAKCADHARAVEDRHHDRSLHAGRLRAGTHVAAGVGLDVARIDGPRSLDGKAGHAAADRDLADHREHGRREFTVQRLKMQKPVFLQQMQRAGIGAKAAYDATERFGRPFRCANLLNNARGFHIAPTSACLFPNWQTLASRIRRQRYEAPDFVHLSAPNRDEHPCMLGRITCSA